MTDKKKKRDKKSAAGFFNTTGTSAEITYPKNGVEREKAELQMEMEDRPYEALEGLAHGFGPIGNRRRGKKFFFKHVNTGKQPA